MSAPRILWIDGVGGYALCEESQVSIGQASPGGTADLAIRGDLSRNAAVIQRIGEDHVLQPIGPCSVDGVGIDRAAILADGMRICLGRVEITFSRPSKLSSTSRLELMGSQRWQPLLSAALLLGDSFVVGAEPGSHIRCPDWTQKAVVFRSNGVWLCRVPETARVEVGGEIVRAPFPLVVGQKIRSDEISMILE